MLKIKYQNTDAMLEQFHCLWEDRDEIYNIASDMKLPTALAWGEISSSSAGKDITLCDTEMAFRKDCSIQEKYIPISRIQLGFCLKGNLTWSYPSLGKKELTVTEGEWFLQQGIVDSSVSHFTNGQHCRGINISFGEQRFQNLLTSVSAGMNTEQKKLIKKGVMTPGLLTVVQQIQFCPVTDNLQALYLEGKILELLAIFLNESVYEEDKCAKAVNLSEEDYRCLRKAKEKIDKSFSSSLTISALAKDACLNEYKLKSGFKQCFGYTVYGYIVHKRMELAYQLVQSGKYRVKDTAWQCGYTNVSHFIENFRKYYGFTPGEMRNR